MHKITEKNSRALYIFVFCSIQLYNVFGKKDKITLYKINCKEYKLIGILRRNEDIP